MSSRLALVVASLALAAGCSSDPDPLVDRAFWRDAARVEAELGVTVVPIEAGEPLWDFPIVAVARDSVRFDARPWLASIDPEALPEGAAEAWSWEVPLVQGAVPEDQLRGFLFVPVFEATRDWRRRVGHYEAGAPWYGVNILPEADVTEGLMKAVLYTMTQAGMASPILVGRVGGELRGAHAGRAEPFHDARCISEVYLEWGEQGRLLGVVQDQHLTSLSVSDDESLAGPIADLARRCRQRWDRALAALEGERVDPASWRCLSVRPMPHDSLPMERLLRSMAEGYRLHPDAVVHFPMDFFGGKPPVRPTVASLDEVDLDPACGMERLPKWSDPRWDPVADLLEDAGTLDSSKFGGASPGAPPEPTTPASEETP